MRLLIGGVLAALGALLGKFSYERPNWVFALKDFIVSRPLRSLALLVGLSALGAAGYAWYVRPAPLEPSRLSVTFIAPTLTDYTQSPPLIQPLVIDFSGSAAPLEALGKAATSITLTPAVEGSWVWTSDRQITFTPAADWPVEESYEVTLDPLKTLAPSTLIDSATFEFQTASFIASLTSAEFYQDPEKPAIKRALLEIAFSHPVDTTSVERRLEFKFFNFAGEAKPAPELAVSFDARKLKAFVQSSALELPERGGWLYFTLKAGTQAARAGAPYAQALESRIELPSLYSLSISNVEPTLLDDARGEPQQTLLLEASGSVRDREFAAATSAYVLPLIGPTGVANEDGSAYGWSTSEVSEAVLKNATPLALTLNAGEREFLPLISFKFSESPQRVVFVRVKKGLKTDGGFVLGQNFETIVRIPDYPQMLRFVGDGALLSLRGERRISVVARNHQSIDLEVQRVLPEQLQHFVNFNSGTYVLPEHYSLSADVLTERFKRTLKLPSIEPGKAHYEGIDLGEFLDSGKRGVFLLSLRADEGVDVLDRRLVVLSDLAMISKRSKNGTREVFVASIQDGTPITGATVRAIAQNGTTLLEGSSDANGQVSIGNLDDFEREQKALMLTAQLGDDLSFLPINGQTQDLDYSRFDVGGEVNPPTAGTLKAHLFTDRGMYRPGDTLNLGLIVRAADWTRSLEGLPLKLEVADARGQTVAQADLKLTAEGLLDWSYPISATAPTGVWLAQLYLLTAENQREDLGSAEFKVREFEPDRIKVRATLSSAIDEGWVSPAGLSAQVIALNLFGTPAQNRRVTATLSLEPSAPRFKAWPDHVFFDPRLAKEGFSEELGEQTTGEAGSAQFDLDLARFAQASYRVTFQTEVFEPEGGRSVAAFARTLVSSNPYLIGIKAREPLSYVERNADRTIEVIALNPDATARAVADLSAVLVEERYVSVLTKQESGIYKYESKLREYEISQERISVGANGLALKLNTATPGTFYLAIRDGSGSALNRISYSVAGAANLTRSLERNAELKMQLSKSTYAPGEEIEFSVIAPYAGSGLITIERDQVVASTWFKADTTASVQRIRVPQDFEGNGYVTVQFLRDIHSPDVFMSPLSYGVLPFKVDRSKRQQMLAVDAPERAKPGVPLAFTVRTDGVAQVIVFAVDEGILQVAGYELADPLDTFLSKRQLEVGTAQVLDLLLPEFSMLMRAAAPGGDAQAALAANLNPFKRKRDKAAVYWSGVVEVNGERTLSYTPPESFNGTLRVMAVAVTSDRIGTFVGATQVRGDFVLIPNAPTTLAPGDEARLSVGVAYPPAPGALEQTITVSAQPSAGLEIVEPSSVKIKLKPGTEGTVRFDVRARASLGPALVKFVASAQKLVAERSVGISVRPLVPYDNFTRMGRVDKLVNTLDGLESMWNELARRELKVAPTPLVLSGGLSAYLQDFPHRCSEQILSQAFPALVIRSRPELGVVFGEKDRDPIDDAIETLRARQNSSGGIGLWTATPEPDTFVSAYAGLFLLEAEDRGVAVPRELKRNTLSYLQTLAQDRSKSSLHDLRARALAIYVLTRSGIVTTQLLAALEGELKAQAPDTWGDDAAAVLLGASLKLLKADREADQRIDTRFKALGRQGPPLAFLFDGYYDPLVRDALTLYLIAKHFPERVAKLPPAAIEQLVDPLSRGLNNTLSSGLSVLALEAYAERVAASGAITLERVDAQGVATPFGAPSGWVISGQFTDQDRTLKINQPKKGALWYVLNQSGYALQIADKARFAGVEVSREYLDSSGKPVLQVALGAELEVRLKLRALERGYLSNLAIIDLLPGGFELVEQPVASTGEAVSSIQDRLRIEGSTLDLVYLDQREDRVVLYANINADISEYRYRIKAVSAGKFKTGALSARSMYERGVEALLPGGTQLSVLAP